MTPGKNGVAFFGFDCFLSCDPVTGNALAAGHSVTQIGIATPNDHYATATTSDSSVALLGDVRPDGTTIEADSGVAGRTTLTLLRADGSVLDSIDIAVHDSATLSVDPGWSGAGPIVLAGAQTVFHVATVDVGGRVTMGSGSVHFATSGTLSGSDFLIGDSFIFSGTPGSGSIVATAPSASAELDVTFVAPSDVVSLQAEVAPSDGGAAVTVTANTALGPVYGGQCAWATSSSSVHVSRQEAAALFQPPAETTQFTLAKAGTFTATCNVGNVATSVSLQR